MTSLALEQVSFDSHAVQALLDEWNDELTTTIPGFTPQGGSTVNATDFQHPNGIFLLAISSQTPVGCGGLRRISPRTGEIKRLYVRPPARRQRAGQALLQRLEQHARDLALDTLRLDTAGGHPAPLALFLSAGYQPIPDYNGNPYARHWFEKSL